MPTSPDLDATLTAASQTNSGTDAPLGVESAMRLDAMPSGELPNFRVVGEVGRGGMGRVARAEDPRLGREVAIKRLVAHGADARARFEREVRITARLQHPAIVPIYETGLDDKGAPFYAMQLVTGRTLADAIHATTTLDQRLELLRHVISVSEAIAYAHSRRVIHRDLKASNVVVGEFGEAVVIDWGLAKDLAEDDDGGENPLPSSADGELTRVGAVLGTPAYMAPEQANGVAVDERADVYALGAMLYHLLAGEVPYPGHGSAEVLAAVRAGPPVSIEQRVDGVPRDLAAIVTKAMARAPSERYPTAREMAVDLARFASGQLVTARHYGRWTLLRRWGHRHRGYIALGAVAAIAIVVIVVGTLRRAIDEQRRAEQRGVEAEHQRAAAEDRQHALVRSQAEAALSSDPTATLAWLKDYPIDPVSSPWIAALLDQAESLGVAAHVWRGDASLRAVAVTRDGAFVALGGHDGKVRLADTVSGAVRILGTRPVLTALGFDSSGTRLVSADVSGEVVLWDLTTGAPHVLGRHESVTASAGAALSHDTIAGITRLSSITVTRIASADGGRVATTGINGSVRIWDLDRRALERDLFATVAPRDRVATAWDGRAGLLRVTGDDAGHLVLRHGDAPPRILIRLPRPARTIAMTPDGRHVVAADGQEIFLVDTVAGTTRAIAAYPRQPAQVLIDPTARRAVVTSAVGEVTLIDLASGEIDLRRGHADGILQATFDDRGERLVTASDDGTARVWDLDTGDVRVLRGHTGAVFAAAMTPNGRTLATVSFDGSARLWRLTDRETVVVGRLGAVIALRALGGDVVRVVSGSSPPRVLDVDVRLREASVRYQATGASLPSDISDNGKVVTFWSSQLVGDVWNDGEVTTTRLPAAMLAGNMSGDGRRAILLLADGRMMRWGVDELVALPNPGPAAISHDGHTIVVASAAGIEIRDASTGATTTRLDAAALGARDGRLVLRFLPDNRRLALTDLTGVRVWSWGTGELVRLVDSTNVGIEGPLEQSPDGSRLFGAGAGRALQVWNARTGAVEMALHGSRDIVLAAAFSPDGRWLATGSHDRSVRVWDLGTGESKVFLGHDGPVSSVAWLGADRLVSSGTDGTLRQWQMPSTTTPTPRELVDRLRVMTSAEVDQDDRPSTPTDSE